MLQLTRRRAATTACLLGLLALPALAEARSKQSGTPAKTGTKSRGVRLKPAPATTYANGQTAADRQRTEDARLTRECRGRPNAGACLGYAR